MTRFAVMLALIALTAFPTGQAPPASPRDRQLFDFDWRFRAGEVESGQTPSLDDKSWDRVDLPHDFMIEGKGQAIVVPGGRGGGGGRGNANLPETPEGPFDARSPGGSGNGYLNGGIGWYRKSFTVPASARIQRTLIEFEGVYMNAEVWLNGHKIGARPYGYSTFQIDLTPFLAPAGTPNVLAVRVLVQQPSTRWYSGAGIYRHVWLTRVPAVHIAQWGVVARAVDVSDVRAKVEVQTTVEYATARAPVVVRSVVKNREGTPVATAEANAVPIGTASPTVAVVLDIPKPHRWSIQDPYLYTVESTLPNGDKVTVPLGIRTIEFTTDGKFLLNGQHVPLQGVCNHHDLGPLGAAAFDRGIERQLEIMKTLGVNAIRTSHNPPAPALLDLADRMGFVVMDEAFDEWKQNKTRFGYGQFFDEWSERDIRDMVRRDRNHPSIVMWSIGNEINEQRNVQVAEAMSARLATLVRDEDPTRPVTSAMNNPTQSLETGFAKPLDLFGVNYNLNVYERVKGSRSYASETSSNYSSRDEYNLVLKDGRVEIQNQLNNHTTSYDLDFPRWGNTAERQFQALAAAPWMAGEFVWTGLDYIGEPTPFNWPNRSSSFGIADLVGFPKDRFYLYQSKWKRQPLVHILPHWTWPAEFAGKEIPVWAYTNAESVELFLNDKSLGTRDWNGVKETHLTWSVPYAPGTLRAVGKRGGKVVAEDRVETTTAAARLELAVDRPAVRADGQDLAFVTVRITDAQKRLSRADGNHLVRFTLTGGGSIAGVDNGDPTNHEFFKGKTPDAAQHKSFHGLQLVVVRAPRTAATLTLKAEAEGLAPATVVIRAR
jgi:beta-galactosidase